MFNLRKRMKRESGSTVDGPASAHSAPEASVSVVIPLYNHARFIAETLGSAMTQGTVLREIIVVDDGSIDDSLATARLLAQNDDRIVVWSQPNQGAHAAINHGMARATGEFIAILNSDDVYEPGRLDALASLLAASPKSDLVASGLSFVDAQSRPVEDAWYEQAFARHDGEGDPSLALVNGNFLMTTSNFVFRRSLVERIGGFRNLRYAHDLDFLLRILAYSGAIEIDARRLMRYRRHENNTINEQHAKVRAEWAVVSAVHLYESPSLSGAGLDSRRWANFQSVFAQHKLTDGVNLALARLHAVPLRGDAVSHLLADQAFMEAIRELV